MHDTKDPAMGGVGWAATLPSHAALMRHHTPRRRFGLGRAACCCAHMHVDRVDRSSVDTLWLGRRRPLCWARRRAFRFSMWMASRSRPAACDVAAESHGFASDLGALSCYRSGLSGGFDRGFGRGPFDRARSTAVEMYAPSARLRLRLTSQLVIAALGWTWGSLLEQQRTQRSMDRSCEPLPALRRC